MSRNSVIKLKVFEYKNIITYIFAIGAAQAVVLFFILWKKKENRFANKFLAVTMIIFAIDLLGGISFLTGYIYNIPWILGLNSSFPYLYGPLIYLYVIFLIHKQDSFLNSNYLHFIPFVLIQIYGLLFFYFESPENQLSLLNPNIPNPWQIKVIGKLIPVSGLTYMIITVLIVLKYNKKIKNSLSNIDHIDFSWLVYLVLGTAIIWIMVVLSYMLDFVFGKEIHANLLIYITLSVFLYSFAIKSYRQPEIELLGTDDEETYKKSGLAEELAREYQEKLITLFKNEQPHLDPKLNLPQLAEKLKISSHNLSEIINTKLNQNFYDFVNSYRVEEVKKNIEGDRENKFSILSHGLEAGFTSKSAFYSAFKKFTGVTPASYRKSLFE